MRQQRFGEGGWGEMDQFPQPGRKPAGEPSGCKVTHFTFALTLKTAADVREGSGCMLLLGLF